MRNIYFVLFMSIFFMIIGCKEEYGKDFIGIWEQVEGNEFPSQLTIKLDNHVYHVDYKYFDLNVAEKKLNQETSDYFLGKTKEFPSKSKSFGKDSYRVKALEAKALSNTVLQGNDFSLRLENGKLKFNEEVYEKK
ncbi:hypothetical protein [Arsenophonus apicola]|uniref:hypothetical protein n=1 Tax=Arsenophonus apicola TaxID=2879119 RepID=UPI003879B7E5